jgi:hypothetical protein
MKHDRGSGRTALPLGKVPTFVMAVVGVAGIAALIAYVMLPEERAPPQPQRSVTLPDSDLVTILVRTTMVAVHQANITGNYTVLRDLAAPALQEKTSTADLALNFTQLRQRKLDLTPVMLLEPNFTQKPVIDGQNMLRLVGTLQSKPVPVAYELAFQTVSGSWRWSAIAIGSVPQAAAPPPPAPPSAAVQDRSPER